MQSWLENDDVIVMSNQDSRCQILGRISHLQHIYHHAKFELSSLSTLGSVKELRSTCYGKA